MVLVWRIMDDLLNSPTFPPPKFPSIRYLASSDGCESFALCCLQFMLLMVTSGMLNYQRLCGLRLHPFEIKACVRLHPAPWD